MSDPVRIVCIGGGSVLWLPRLGADLLLTPELADAELVLHDLDAVADGQVAAWLRLVATSLGVPARITVEPDLARALDGASHVLITIAAGGLEAMRADLAIPEEFGVLHTVGDTSGPGGWARFLRNAPVFAGLAEAVDRHAPGALVLNYSNPMPTLTQVLAARCRSPVVGLCHGLFENLEFLQRLYGLAQETDLTLSYAGLNHFFWVTAARTVQGTDILADLRQRLRERSLTELETEKIVDGAGHSSLARELATDLMRRTGFLPYIGDRHTCEFVPGIISDAATMRRLRLERTSVDSRVARRTRGQARLVERIAAGVPPRSELKRTRETAADIIAAHSSGRAFVDVGNLPNTGQIGNLPRGLVVETAMRVDRGGFTPLLAGDLPAAVMPLVAPHAACMDLLARSFLAEDRAGVLTTLQVDPLLAHLPHARVAELARRLLAANAAWLPGWLRR